MYVSDVFYYHSCIIPKSEAMTSFEMKNKDEFIRSNYDSIIPGHVMYVGQRTFKLILLEYLFNSGRLLSLVHNPKDLRCDMILSLYSCFTLNIPIQVGSG